MYNDLKRVINTQFDIDTNYNKILSRIHEMESTKENKNMIYVIASVCVSLVLMSGIAIATNMENIKSYFRWLGSGIDTAINNGYIAKPEMEYIKVENIGVKVKIEDFLMDDFNLSTNFALEFDESITNTINMENVNRVELSDLIVRDEENRIIYCTSNKEAFEKYCQDNNLDYKFEEFNENYRDNGLNDFIQNKTSNSINLMYNMNSDKFPKSKKLYFSFNTIIITEYTHDKEIRYELSGSWSTTVDVPKSMYNRSYEYYKVISCDNKDFDVYTAKVTDTGFEIGIIISNIEKPKYDEERRLKYYTSQIDYENGKISKEELEELKNWNNELKYLSNPISVLNFKDKDENNEVSYIENENNKTAKSTLTSNRETKNGFLEENKYNFYETFALTKYDATNKVKVVLYYYGEPVSIELEKI